MDGPFSEDGARFLRMLIPAGAAQLAAPPGDCGTYTYGLEGSTEAMDRKVSHPN
jgi:hypothetical protein